MVWKHAFQWLASGRRLLGWLTSVRVRSERQTHQLTARVERGRAGVAVGDVQITEKIYRDVAERLVDVRRARRSLGCLQQAIRSIERLLASVLCHHLGQARERADV